MSSLISANSSEGESILPEVEELSVFHPDQLSSLVDIQEELEKLEASGDVSVEVMSMSTVDDVNVVDHEVTIVAEEENVESILPEIMEIEPDIATPDHFDDKTNDSYMSIIEESLDIGETITIGAPNTSESRAFDEQIKQTSEDKYKTVAIKPAVQSTYVPPLKAIRPFPDALKGRKPYITVAQPKKNVLTKVIFTPNNQPAPDAPIIFGEAGGQAIRIVGQNKTIINTPKTITLAQAREMGLLSPGKMHQLLPSQSKGLMKNKTVTMVKSSPTKILPLPTTGQLHPIAPSPAINSLTTPHKIFIRQSPSAVKSGAFTGTILTSTAAGGQGQILQIPVSQDNANNHQIHQIQLPGKQVQFVRLVTPSTTSVTTATDTSVAPPPPLEAVSRTTPVSTAASRPVPVALSTTVTVSPQHKVVPIAPAQTQNTNSFERVLVSPGLSQLASRPDSRPSANIVMVPAEYVKQYKPLPPAPSPPSSPKPPAAAQTPVQPTPPMLTKAKDVSTSKDTVTPQSTQKSKLSSEPPNGIRPRKPCNCTKSQCLKLYCDCFANGEFCFQCNCNSCFNNLDHEEERQRAIKACLERNPNAFRPKIGKGYIGDERRHNKGCNCKRSGCLKNYCECYEAKISCSNNCKCVGCRNVEESKDNQDRSTTGSSEGSKINQQIAIKNKLSSEIQESACKPHPFLTNQGTRQPFTLMSQQVVEATCQCLFTQVTRDDQLTEQVERLILEEFGRCLVQIIDCARTTVNNTT